MDKLRIPAEFRLPLVFAGLAIVIFCIAIILFVQTVTSTEPIRFSSDEKSASESSKLIVDVSGAVKNPGVYSLQEGKRVSDAIAVAGGFSAEADLDAVAFRINQASVLSDGAKVYIPKKEQGGQIAGSSSRSPSGSVSGVVSVNTASQSELEALSGIGAVTAKKIIDNRPYTKLEDLMTKKAMGPSLFDKLKNQMSL